MSPSYRGKHIHLHEDMVMDRACQIQSENCPGFGMVALWLVYNMLMVVGLVLALPVVVPLMLSSGKRRHTMRQRLGWWRYPWQSSCEGKTGLRIWVHALSVGEVLAAQPLIQRINDQNPDLQVVLTVSTLTGFQTASRLFAETSVHLAYFPYDAIWSVRAVANKIAAQAVILVETDIWPNFMVEMHRRQVPVYLVNMRLSDNAWKKSQQFKWIAGKLFGAFTKICVQTPVDAGRLAGLGVGKDRLQVTGNIKFDGVGITTGNPIETSWQENLRQVLEHPVVVAGSTHDGEEELLLDTWVSLKRAGKMAHIILAPRDPDRAQMILDLCERKGLDAICLSQFLGASINRAADVIVVDFLGTLRTLYGLAQVAFVGGSLVNEGGHNPIEPAFFGKPIVFGPDMSDFRQIATWLLQAGGARQVSYKQDLATVFRQLLDDSWMAESIGARAKNVVQEHQGAVKRILTFIDLPSAYASNQVGVDD